MGGFTHTHTHIGVNMFLIAFIGQLIKRAFEPATYGQELEQFVASHNPSTVADVEYWIDQYDRRQQRKPSGMFGYR